MINKTITLLFTAIVLTTMLSCNKDPLNSIETPLLYEFERDGESTVNFSGQTERILMADELIGNMMNFETTSAALLEMYRNQTASGGDANPYSNAMLNASSKSVKSKVAASVDFFSGNASEAAEIRADFETWINAQVTEVFPNQDQLAEPGTPGQIAEGSTPRFVNGKGLEYNQAVNKGLIGALMTDQIINHYLSTSVLDDGNNVEANNEGITEEGQAYTSMEHKWDEAYGYFFGTAVDPADPLASLGNDNFLNKYLARTENDPDFAGIAESIFNAFKLGRAAIVAGNYTVRDEQAEIIRDHIATIIAVRAVYYLQQGKINMQNGPQGFGAAFHDFSEGFGFIYSLRFLRQPNSSSPYFTKAEVDGYLNKLMEGNGFWDVTPQTLDEMSQSIASKFNFTVEQAAE